MSSSIRHLFVLLALLVLVPVVVLVLVAAAAVGIDPSVERELVQETLDGNLGHVVVVVVAVVAGCVVAGGGSGLRGRVSENLNLRADVLVLLQLLQEQLLVVGPALLLPNASRPARRLLLRDVHALELPPPRDALLPPPPPLLLVALLHQQHVRELNAVLVLLQLRVDDLQGREVVAERGVPGVEVVAQVRLGVQNDVVDAEIRQPGNLYVGEEVLARALAAHVRRFDVQHDVLRHHLRGADGLVRGSVVLVRGDPDLPQSRRVGELERRADPGDEHDGADAAEPEGHLVRKANDVLLAHGHDLHHERVLVVVRVVVGVVAHELLVVPRANGHDLL
mmetsp:Transcript_6978/g.27447  ORF Transcript_6978/g.27447 Transcript_6978/m.27447 type:complete len:336 (-) Transcript_6978:657-1664(-)